MDRKTATEIIQSEKESEQNEVTLEDFYLDKTLLNKNNGVVSSFLTNEKQGSSDICVLFYIHKNIKRIRRAKQLRINVNAAPNPD